MGYKAKFDSVEIFKNGTWQDIGNPADHASEMHPLSTDPIAEQVAKLDLPDVMSRHD